MDFLIAFLIFAASMVASIIYGFSMLIPLVVGYFAFAAVAVFRGNGVSKIFACTFSGCKKGLVVVKIMICIGILTAMWRAGGTILFFVYYGAKLITPHTFILMAFLLCGILSYALGTSFGVAGTMGYILMTIAAAGDANLVMTAGAVMSGIYVGDRCSYASSSAALTAMLTETTIEKNVPLMLKTSWIATLLSAVLYAGLSYFYPAGGTDESILDAITAEYSIAWPTLIPALIMFIMPLFRVPVWITMLISAACAFGCAVFLQGGTFLHMLFVCLAGMPKGDGRISSLLSGGGIYSMLEISLILLISCSYSEIFEEADMLKEVTEKMSRLIGRAGRFVTTFIIGTLACGLFCNQTIGDIVAVDVLNRAYRESGGDSDEFAMDIENTLILTAGLIPWCLACKVPLTLLGADIRSLPFSFLLYLIPITYLFTKRWFFGSARGKI